MLSLTGRVEGVEVIHQNNGCTVPPKRCVAWRAVLTPLATGSLQIVGLRARILGCIHQEFRWPASALVKGTSDPTGSSLQKCCLPSPS